MKQLVSAIFFCLVAVSGLAQTWDKPVHLSDPAVFNGGLTGQYTSMATVNGNPAIAYYNTTNYTLVYMRATNANGTSWGNQVTLDAEGDVGKYACMIVVSGNPAVAYYDATNGDLKYIRANDANGDSWGDPVVVGGTSNLGYHISMKIVNGNPAFSYFDIGLGRVRFCRANDAVGSTWGTKVNVTTSGLSTLTATSLEVVKGYPAIAYIYDNGTSSLKYVRATDSNGTAWGTHVSAAFCNRFSLSSDQICNLAVVNGYPAIMYYGNSSTPQVTLAYTRATDSTGTAWGAYVLIDTAIAARYGRMAIVNDTPAVVYYREWTRDLWYTRGADANGTAWGTPVMLDNGIVGKFNSLAIINGQPAVSYNDETNGDLKYIRATNATGSSWGSALSFTAGTGIGQYTSFVRANGNPAMAYYDQGNGDLKYMRATNSTGSTWGTPVSVDATGTVGQYTSAAIINGNPAISYYDSTNGDLKYVRATDASGSTWGTPVVVDNSADVGQYSKLLVVNGNPAIAYYDLTNGDLKYVRATDVSGSTWGSPVTVTSTDNIGQHLSMLVVNGNPAISYYDVTNGDLKYVRATDASGSTWGSPVTVESTNNIGQYTSLYLVSGNPAVGYYDVTNTALKYVRASDVSGSTWGTAVTVASTDDVGSYASLAVVNGYPALFYKEVPTGLSGLRRLKYIRASNATGTAWGTAVTLDVTGGGFSSVSCVDSSVYCAYYSEGHQLPSFIRGEITFVWTGAASTTNWFTAANWEGGMVPGSGFSVTIPGSLSFYPDISSGTATCRKLSISSGATVTVSGGTLQVSDTLSNSGTLTATSGTVELNGSSAQVITAGTGTSIRNLTLNNSAGATIVSGTLNITGTYTPTSGTLATGGNLVLKSGVSGTARIAAGAGGGGYLTGNVTVEKYIPGKRAFRFLAHPFNASIALSQLTDDIDITGSGGATNGFTATSSNNPSSYWWDVTAADNTTTGSNPGWVAYTNTNGAGANAWNQYAGARILVRGAKGEGLWGGTYTPSATTVDMSGAVNQGDQVIGLTKGSNSDFIMIGNPFPSQVDMNLTTGRTNMGSAYYVWDATQGTRGGYTSNNFSSSYILPAYASIITTLSGNGSITFPESCKSTSADAGLFKTTGVSGMVQLRMEDSTVFWDRLLVRFEDATQDVFDYEDAKELYNPEVSFYSFSKDDTLLSIDSRPYADSSIIPLGLYTPFQKNFRIRASELKLIAGTRLYLRDKYLNKTEEIDSVGYEYWFAVTADSASWGDKRFELQTTGKPVVPNTITEQTGLKVSIAPNPTDGNVTVFYKTALPGTVLQLSLKSITGATVFQKQVTAGKSNTIPVSLDNCAPGIYVLELTEGHSTIRSKIVRR